MKDVTYIGKEVNHKICEHCPYNDTCTTVCFAVECLVQIALETKILKKLEMLDNAADLLDLENSIKGDD